MSLLSDPSALLWLVAHLALLGGIAAIMFAPAVPGLAVMLVGVLAYVAIETTRAGTLAGIGVAPLVGLVLVAAAGLSAPWWTGKLRLGFTYVSQQVMWGALIGSFVGIFIAGIVGMLIGLIAGTMIMEVRGGRSVPEALRHGLSALTSMLGPRGFQLVMALVFATIALSGLPSTPMAGMRLQSPGVEAPHFP